MIAERLELNGASFELVCVRRSAVAVYRGDGTYLRLGSAIADELAAQRRMLDLGYPVPAVLEVGEHGGATFVIEESLGEATFGDLWANRPDAQRMTHQEWSAFRGVMRRHALAQLRDTRPWQWAEVADFLGVLRACENLPLLATPIEAAFEHAARLLGPLPSTFQHGDLHPYNTCERGIIDLEGAGWAPAGYDVITALLEPTLAEACWDDGRVTLAWFSRGQVATYLDALDVEFRRASLPLPSRFVDAYLVCRGIAICSHIHPDPEVWDRRRRVLERSLACFLQDGRFPIELGHAV